MALTVPSAEDLLFHMRREAWDSDLESDYADDTLQRSCDLFTLATELDTDPSDGLTARVVRVGILAMAHAIFVQAEDKDKVYAPFSGERLGSYSYSKMQMAASSGMPTGVVEFDTAVNVVRAGDEDFALSSSEKVFHHGQSNYERDLFYPESTVFEDPSETT